MIALDYTQPTLSYCFTLGVVASWLCEALAATCCPGRRLAGREGVRVFVCTMCTAMLAAVNTIDAKVTPGTLSCVACGFAWPVFFARNATAVCRRPYMILHSVRASHMTVLLLCFSPLTAWTFSFEMPRRTLLVLFVAQPAIKAMCGLILCLSIQTGHTTDIAIVLSVASCSQFVLLYPLDHAYQIVCVLGVSALLSVHVFCLCYRRPAAARARAWGAPV